MAWKMSHHGMGSVAENKWCMTGLVYRQGRISQGEGGQVLGQHAEGGGLLRHQRPHRLGHQAAGDSSSWILLQGTVCQGFRIPIHLFLLVLSVSDPGCFTQGFHWKFTMRLLSSLVSCDFIIQCFGSALVSVRIRIRIWIQHFLSMRIRIQIWSFNDQNLEKIYSWNKIYIFSIKNCNYP